MISRSLLDTKVSPRRSSICTSLRQNSVSVFAPRPLHLTLTCSASLRRVSAMNSTIVLQTVPKRIWQMPIVPEFCRSEVQIELRRGDTFVSSKERDIIERKSRALQHRTAEMTKGVGMELWKVELLP